MEVRARFNAFLVFPDFELWLGELESRKRVDALPLKMLPALRLQFSENIGPEPTSFSGREFIVPLQGCAELRDEHEREEGGGIRRGPVNHNETPIAEVTPEMIEAGRAAFWSGDLRFDLDEEIVVRIYHKMEEARRQECSSLVKVGG